MFETILLPMDHSKQSGETAKKSIDLALKEKSHIYILSVLDTDQTEESATESMRSIANRVRNEIENAGITTDLIERKGTPAFVICDVADELNADVIVMGTLGIRFYEEGTSTTARVIDLSPCPVLVIP